MEQNVVLCGANSYDQKYYLNQEFSALPDAVKQELQIMCVWFTEDVGGILTLEFEPDGTLIMKTTADDMDYEDRNSRNFPSCCVRADGGGN